MGRNTKQLTRRQRTAASVSTGAGMTAYQGASHSDLALRDWQPFAGSPDTLVRKANAGDVQGACAELSRWTYAAGKQLPGLVQRRAAERKMCEGGLA